MAVISLSLFIIVEKRAISPLIDFKIMLDKNLLTSNILIMIIGLSMFMVFQTIPVLIRSPVPFGFGDTASNVGNVQLPFALVLLVFGPSSGFIISKLGSLKPIIIGTIISAVGFTGILLLHQTEIGISVNLAILSAGLSLTSVGAMNVIILSTPRQSSGMSLGISSLMRIVGASIGPALAGMYMQSNQVILTIGGMTRFFPSRVIQSHISNCCNRLYHIYSVGTATETESSGNGYTECFLAGSFSLFIDNKRRHFYIILITVWRIKIDVCKSNSPYSVRLTKDDREKNYHERTIL
jgi:hypothetical protein